ncbi:cobalamin biosynthesis protein [Rhodococcus tibetensis]|uniref:Cobalamin biosynthesis protein n=1 Tax=Rhodococcus tibetensis TaxID=2965064 RepID=A0ABT1QAS7_9NOCA|nr:cobalamin biosynthesis protein [Rhodococcus sp. FXJ9.536]MCQ4119359.1 cobalamin biosynthesis protein [Rhodococcus sp. FXJ9.536]
MAEICVGVGFRMRASSADIISAVRRILESANVGEPAQLICLGTLERKAKEPAVLGAAASLGVPVLGFDARDLAAVVVPNPSGVVNVQTGSPSVAEAAAVLGAGGGPLIVPKRSANGVVVAAARKVS